LIIGVTGTKGKTTICSMLHHCFVFFKKDVASFTTIGARKNETAFKLQDPSLSDLSNLLVDDAQNKILEMTSFCLELSFFDASKPDCVIMTGIEQDEHTEIHDSFNDYLDAKKRIFKIRKPGAKALVCRDDKSFHKIAAGVQDIYTYGFDENSDCVLKIDKMNPSGMAITLTCPDVVKIKTKLLGRHNAANIAACYLALIESGFEKKQAIKAIEKFSGVEGRFERFEIRSRKTTKTVLIDYAHTPRSLQINLELVRKIFPNKSICTVFGCGGNKSQEKRPKMGEVVEKLSDFAILTNDNPRKENPLVIISHILGGMTKRHQVEQDRKSAIRLAIESNADVVFLAGKGSEDYYIDAEGYHPNMSDSKLLTAVCAEKKFTLKKI